MTTPQFFTPPESELVNIPVSSPQEVNTFTQRLVKDDTGVIYVNVTGLGWVPLDKCVLKVDAEKEIVGIPPLPLHSVDAIGTISCAAGQHPRGNNLIIVRGATIGRIGLMNASHTNVVIIGGDYPTAVVSLAFNWSADASVQHRQSLSITIDPSFQGTLLDLDFDFAKSTGLLLVHDPQEDKVSPFLHNAIMKQELIGIPTINPGVMGLYHS